MRKPDIFIFGASDHARVVIDIVEREGKYNIVGLFDSFKKRGLVVGGYEVLGNEQDLVEYAAKTDLVRGIVGIGDNAIRRRIAETIEARVPYVEWVSTVHPSSNMTDSVNIAGGAIVMARCYVGLNTTICPGAVVATNSILEHDGVLGAYATLGAGSTTGGRVRIGKGTAVCLGVTIIHGISIGDEVVIGSGSIVLNDIPDFSVAYGSPAKVVRSRRNGDSYLHIRSESYIPA
jgi:sugar O-acyltransferase (sialic acid O-acetyltransferase NeuD family)